MIAWLALAGWPIAAIVFFKKYAAPLALCLTIMGGYLLLPTRIGLDLPILPRLDKTSIPTLIAALLTVIAAVKMSKGPNVLKGWIPRDPVVILLVLLIVGGIFGSVLTNREPLVYGPRVLQGHRFYDAGSFLLEIGVLLVPLFLARKLLAAHEGQRLLLLVFVISAFVYSFLALYEIRMSPQLNMMLYGFFPHEFAQHMRGDGFRPVVFLGHGLALSLFLTAAMLAATGLFRIAEEGDQLKWLVLMAWLFAILVLSKSLGALVIAVVLLPIALFLHLRLQLLLATCIAIIVLTYPMLRAADLVPVDRIMEVAYDINPNRAQSFMTRLENEETLLAKAKERPVFGWGGWGRQRVFDEYGNNLSVTDGSWVIELGYGGWVRYIGFFGLLCWPIIGLFLGSRARIDPVCVTLALMLCAKLIDLVPNSGVPPIYWLIVGSLIGRLEMKMGAEETAQGPPVRPGYRRPDAPVPGPDRETPQYARSFSGEEHPARPEAKTSRPRRAAVRRNVTLEYRR